MSLIAELKRRNVFRVGVAYAIVAWLLLEVASVIFPGLHLPDWTLTFLIIVILAGFPLALIVAWAFELTPEGIKLETAVDSTEPVTRKARSKLDFAIVGLLVIAVVYFAVDKFVLEGGRIPATGSNGQVKTIAVLPFANMSGDPEQEFFSDGISEELLNVLAKVKGLRVTSRTSAFAFKGKDISIPEIAEKLGVEHVLEGSVRMAGDRVRITTQLIDVETDSHLWTASYDRELSDIFAVQDEIAAKVGEALKVALLGVDSTLIRSIPETSIDVYSDYLLARQKLANVSFLGMGEAEFLKCSQHQDHQVFVFRASDRFGDSGLVGIASLKVDGSRGQIQDFVLSCRMMGRGVERTMLHVLVNYGQSRGLEEIVAVYLPTERNKPCLEFFQKGSGFDQRGAENHFAWDLNNEYPAPSFIQLEMDAGDQG